MQSRPTRPKIRKAEVKPQIDADDAQRGSDPTNRDLVGWGLSGTLSRPRRLTPEVSRTVLATALGLDAQALAALDTADIRTAIDRLRALTAHTEALAEMAATDDLTGATRRSPGLAALQREIDRARRLGDRDIVAAFLDVDGLKLLNDTEGHAAGDRILKHVVTAIRDRVRSYDLVIRYGGDEFVCGLMDVTLADARRTVADIRHQFEERSGGHSVSVGLAQLKADDTAETVVARADAALYSTRRKAAL